MLPPLPALAPVQQAQAKTNFNIDVGIGLGGGGFYPGYGYGGGYYPVYEPYYGGGKSCWQVKHKLKMMNFKQVQPFDCSAPTYVNERGEPADPRKELCSTRLRGKLVGANETSLEIALIDGTTARIGYRILPDPLRLALIWADQTDSLRPGRRNDLLVLFNEIPEVQAAKRRMVEAAMRTGMIPR